MGEAFALLVLLLFAGIAFVVLRLTLGPGRYGIIVETIAGSLLTLLFFGGLGLVLLFSADTEPMSASFLLALAVFMGFVLIGLGMLWLSVYALWFWRRPLAEVDDDGVRFWALAYRHVPWSRIAAVVDRSDNTEIRAWYVLFVDGCRERLGYLPLSARQIIVGWGREPAEITAAADLIRKHPEYRGKAITL